ncbi:MAG: DUF547 domain-containing protein [Deltaproteobacteria bacterium]|nr:MAG: DUF547 domain-containing protein [Deltaproteobacteria bacterium]
MMHRPAVWAGIALLGLACLVYGAWRMATRPHLRPPRNRSAVVLPERGFSHAAFESLLREFLDAEGRMDYARLAADPAARERLEGYLAALAAASPENAPERFPTPADRTAYWLYAYNALVVAAIVDHWPIETVHDVRAPVELVRGLGFFYVQRFILGGRTYSLYELEKTKAAPRGGDPRVHFVLNCGSTSCPALQPNLPTGDDLERFLAERARAFVHDPRHVRIDDEQRVVHVSRIFLWYEDDFIDDLRRRGRPADRGIVDVLAEHGGPDVRARLAGEWTVEPLPYDWSIAATKEAK